MKKKINKKSKTIILSVGSTLPGLLQAEQERAALPVPVSLASGRGALTSSLSPPHLLLLIAN